MELTKKQKEALEVAVARYNLNMPYTCISGYAGTGKSTVVKFIIAALEIKSQDVAYVAFTGKAAEVLRQKGCPNACTAHHLLYYTHKLKNGKFVFRPRPKLEYPYKLIIVDEISMLPIDLWKLLLTHHVPIIALGDPGQLPPINKNDDNHVLDNPHVFLDEIMRQALDSEIIKLSMDIREGNPIKYFKGNEVQIIRPNEVIDGMYNWADIVICATNKKRNLINNKIRALNGLSGEPQIGDKLISLTNHWDIFDTEGEANLVNGTIGTLAYCYEDNIVYPIKTQKIEVPALISSFKTETDENFESLMIDKKCIINGNATGSLTNEQEYAVYKSKLETMPPVPLKFNYGYAITCHRAQGSSWPKVIVFEENFPFDTEEHRKWLYTSVTRAEERLILVR